MNYPHIHFDGSPTHGKRLLVMVNDKPLALTTTGFEYLLRMAAVDGWIHRLDVDNGTRNASRYLWLLNRDIIGQIGNDWSIYAGRGLSMVKLLHNGVTADVEQIEQIGLLELTKLAKRINHITSNRKEKAIK